MRRASLLDTLVQLRRRAKAGEEDLTKLIWTYAQLGDRNHAFDLLERIYEEAWHDPHSPKSERTGRALRDDFESVEALKRAVPKAIVEYNLHGIDIDARAVQIAALALWLRAQKRWKALGYKAAERPRISTTSD